MFPRWHLSYARGYLLLGLLDAASEELAALPPEYMEMDDTIILQASVLQEQNEWLRLEPLAADLVRRHPEAAEWWVMWAYATRRADSLHAAQDILLEAETRHPNEATIQFNLACYACQLGDLDLARVRAFKAIQLDRQFAVSAKTDSDLAPLRATGWSP